MTEMHWQSRTGTPGGMARLARALPRPLLVRQQCGSFGQEVGYRRPRAASSVPTSRARSPRKLGRMPRSAIHQIRYRTVALAISIAALATLAQPGLGQIYRVDTVLGDFDPLEEVPLSAAWTANPVAVAVDSSGSVYFAESGTGRVRKVDPSGRVSTIAGSGLTGNSGDGGSAIRARFGDIRGLAIGPSGEIYIADADHSCIRRVDSAGTIDTIAGTGAFGWDGDGGPATQATLTAMSGLATDRGGNLYIADTWADRIRKIDTDGIISTIAGTGDEGRAGDGGPAVEARLNRPRGVAVDGSGSVYIADTANHVVRRVDATGTITTFAGTGDAGYSGDGSPATEAELHEPFAVAIDNAGNVFIADTRNRTVRKVDPAGIITTVAGTGPRGRGPETGIGTEVRITRPRALAIGPSGDVYIANSWGSRILRLDDAGMITILVGLGRREFESPRDVAVDSEGNAYVVYGPVSAVVKVAPSGHVTPFAGTGRSGFSGDGGPAVDAQLAFPGGVATDDNDNVYISDSSNHRIRMVDRTGAIRTIAGNGARGFSGDGGPATQASFNYPAGVAAGADGSVYVADRRNHRIRKIDSDGIVTTIAGTGRSGTAEAGVPAIRASFRRPVRVDVDSAGRVYIPDDWTHRVYMVDNAGILRIVAGNGELHGGGDGGPATDAALGSPRDVAISDSDTLYIADTFSHSIRKVTSDGIIATIAGTGEGGYNGDGSPARDYHLRFPTAVASRSDRRVWVADTLNHRFRLLSVEVPAPAISSVLNAASRSSTVAPGVIAVVQGTDLASDSSPAIALPRSTSLPTILQGTSVIIAHDSGTESAKQEAGLYSVTPTETTFRMPEDFQSGLATVTVMHEGGLSEPIVVQVSRVAPGLFAANGDGRGVAAATAFRVSGDGTRTQVAVSRYDPDQKRYVAVPLDAREILSRVYLTLFGTGLRGGVRPAAVTIRGRHVRVESAGPSRGFPGVDELVVGPIHVSAGSREVEVIAIVDGERSNAVTIALK